MGELKTVTVIGAGTMGHALALIFARGGKEVFLTDVSKAVVEQALELIRSHLKMLKDFGECQEPAENVMKRIAASADSQACARESDMVVEAIIEDTEAKKSLYAQLAGCLKQDAILASNTSYLNIFPLAPAALQRQLLITHYFSPPYILPLVEIVGGPHTDQDVIARAVQWLKGIRMTPVTLKQYVPGFIVNRLQRAVQREVLYMVEQGWADPIEIDKAVKATLGIRLPILAFFAKYDFTGLDMVVRGLQAPSIGLANEEHASPVTNLVEKGQLGVKSGKGFYDYSDRPLSDVLRERDIKLVEMLKLLRKLGEVE